MAETYEITPEHAGYFNLPLLLILFAGIAIAISLRLLIGYAWPPATQPSNIETEVLTSADFGMVFSWLAVFFIRKQSSCELIVSEDSITVHRAFFTRRVPKNQIQAVVETPRRFRCEPGLRISKSGFFGAWILGDIWIPKALPEYEHIRNLVLSWKNSVD
ncbi:MAG: hypothetical protein ACRD5K_11330 [Candidatus Acidiferrales bacterium]